MVTGQVLYGNVSKMCSSDVTDLNFGCPNKGPGSSSMKISH